MRTPARVELPTPEIASDRILMVSVNDTYVMQILLSGARAEDRVAVATYLRQLADLVEKGDLDEELGAGVI